MSRAVLALLLAVALAVAPRPARCEAPEGSAATTLAQAEALQSGSGGRYDPVAAAALFEQASATGDPLASHRLALVLHLRKPPDSTARARAATLAGTSAAAVRELADAGDPYAQYLVGTAALVGLGGPADLSAARRWLELAAAEGPSWVWHNLAWMRETGTGFDRSASAAIDGYRRAAAAGNAASMLDLARLTLRYDGSGASCDEGLEFLQRAAEVGHPDAAPFLGKLFLYGRGACVKPAPAAAMPWLEAAAEAGDLGAHYDLGIALLTGEPTLRDPDRARRHLERPIEIGDHLAIETMAYLLATGAGLPRDPAQARLLFAEAVRLGSDGLPRLSQELALQSPLRSLFDEGVEHLETLAAGGDPEATALLADIVYRGVGGAGDPERGVILARRAAAAGVPQAMRTLAHAYNSGRGVDTDRQEALRWWQRGADAGDSFCMMFYSQTLMKGERVERDLESGLAWLVRSGEAGNWWAIGDLGRLYDEGWYGLPRQPERAAVWKQKRAALGDAEARGWLLYHDYDVD